MRRWMRRWEGVRGAASVLGVVWIALVAAYLFGAIESAFTPAAAIAAAAALAIAAAGFLYAWREPASPER